MPLLFALLILASFLALDIGAVKLDEGASLNALLDLVMGKPIDDQQQWIVRELRLPRVLLAILVGMGLAVAGVITQGIFRNPLADPGLIGVSSGAALAAVAIIVLGNTWLLFLTQILGSFTLPLAAFCGGLLVTLIMYRLGTSQGQTHMAMLLLVGVAINVIAGALTGILTYMADDQQLRNMTFWSMGSLAHGSYSELFVLAIFELIPLAICLRYARLLNAMLLGEEVAGHLGYSVQRAKLILVICAALMVGAGVAVSGMIGFIGLVIPHGIRLIFGPDHKLLIPASALAGAVLLLVADMFARTILAPAEVPIGLVMAVLGGPVFLLLLMKQVRRWQ